MMKFTTILWDVDDTLLDFPYSERYALVASFQAFGKEITEEIIQRYSEINISFWKRLELGRLLRGNFCPDVFRHYFKSMGYKMWM